MSDNWIVVLPADPGFLPDETQKAELHRTLSVLAPKAQAIEVEADGGSIVFFDCGSNFGTVHCAGCGEELDQRAWSEWMDADYGSGPGFALSTRRMSCCGAAATLNDLNYVWPQGFAAYGISARNCDRGRLTDSEIAALSRALGAPARVIYRHL